ncbi:MAG: lppC [Gammaproteobacteria bacterium]|nr:lppC [Gammaproteobacteria bacterium]
MMRYTHTIIFVLLISLLSLTGCSSVSFPEGQSSTVLSATDAIDHASVYLTQADAAESSEKEANTLLAAQILSEANLIDESDTILQRVNTQSLTPDLFFTYTLLKAHINVSRGNAAFAMQQLSAVSNQVNDMPQDLQRDYYHLMADAAYLSKHPLDSIRARVSLDNFLNDPQSRLQNSEQLWTLLQTLPSDSIEGLSADTRDPIQSAWAQLALISANANDVDELSQRGFNTDLFLLYLNQN